MRSSSAALRSQNSLPSSVPNEVSAAARAVHPISLMMLGRERVCLLRRQPLHIGGAVVCGDVQACALPVAGGVLAYLAGGECGGEGFAYAVAVGGVADDAQFEHGWSVLPTVGGGEAVRRRAAPERAWLGRVAASGGEVEDVC